MCRAQDLERTNSPEECARPTVKRFSGKSLERVFETQPSFVVMVKRLVQWAERECSPLARFLGCHFLPGSRLETCRWWGLKGSDRPFPCWPPYPPERLPVPLTTRGRKQARFSLKWARRIFSNALAGVLSWQALGRPEWVTEKMRGEKCETVWREVVGGGLDVCEGSLRANTKAAILRFNREIWEVSREAFSGVSGGRSTLVQSLRTMVSSSYTGSFSAAEISSLLKQEDEVLNERAATSDQPFLAHRQGIPKATARVPLNDWIPCSWAEVMKKPKQELVDPAPRGPIPRRYHAPRGDEWEKFLQRKADSGMVSAVGMSHVPVGPEGQDLWSGVFAVGKSAEEDRVIDDRRRMNWRERRWVGRKPAHAIHYSKGAILPGRRRRYHVVDAPHFYHNLDTGRQHLSHSPTGPPLRRSVLEKLGVPICKELDDGGEFLQPCSITLVMGDGKGVTLAQEAHMGMVKAVGAREEWMTAWDLPDPRGGVRASMCIDDYLMEEDVAETMKDSERTAVDDFIDSLLELYAYLHIPPKEEKLQLRKRKVVSLGAGVDGDSGRVGIPPRTLSQIQLLTVAAAMGAPLDKKAGQKLVGLWIFVLMFRREAFSMLEAVFNDVLELSETSLRPLQRNSRDELMSLVLLGPILFSSMRWQVSPTIFSTDAEGSGGSAIVAADLLPEVALEVFRYAAIKGDYAKLEGDQQQLDAKTKLEDELCQHQRKLDVEVRRNEVKTRQLEVDDAEEMFPGVHVGQELLNKRLARGEKVWGSGDVSANFKSFAAESESLYSQPILRDRVLKGLNPNVSQALSLASLKNGVRNRRETMEACGVMPPAMYLQRCVLVWGSLGQDLVCKLRTKNWKIFNLEGVISQERKKNWDRVVQLVETLVKEGCFAGCMVEGNAPRWMVPLWEMVKQIGGFDVRWSQTKIPGDLRWESSEQEDKEMFWLRTDTKLSAMLRGARDDEEGEDDGRFLLGRRGLSNRASLVKAIEEHYDNVASVRQVKRRAWGRSPWENALGSLVEVLPWRLVRRWKDPKVKEEHINILELRAKRKLVARCARRCKFHNLRHIHISDSRVAQAVANRGRSSSKLLNHEMRMMVPDIIGGSFAMPTYWSESARMPADEPSRGKEILPPAVPSSAEQEFLAGRAPLISDRELRAWRRGRWRPRPPPPLRRTLYGHRGQRVGEAKKPGPRPPQVRDRREYLEKKRGEKMTIQYARGMRGLEAYLSENNLFLVEDLAEQHPRVLNEVLSAWVRHCYDNDMTKDYAVAALLAFSDRFWWTRHAQKATWDLVGEWEVREPTEHRAPAPATSVRACIGVAVCWGWHRVAVLLWLGFHCLLRPGELVDLKVKDMRFVDTGEGVGVFIIVIQHPKTARKYARVQHVMCDEPLLVLYLRWILEFRNKDDYFYGMTAATLADRLERILEVLGLQGLFTLAGLRAGGATWQWIKKRNFDELRLRGRWAAQRTLEAYIQECASQLSEGSVSQRQRTQIENIGRDGAQLIADLVS